jgi:hypothetical protein
MAFILGIVLSRQENTKGFVTLEDRFPPPRSVEDKRQSRRGGNRDGFALPIRAAHPDAASFGCRS